MRLLDENCPFFRLKPLSSAKMDFNPALRSCYFIAVRGLTNVLQCVMYDELGAIDDTTVLEPTSIEQCNGMLVNACVAFEFLCGTLPGAITAKA